MMYVRYYKQNAQRDQTVKPGSLSASFQAPLRGDEGKAEETSPGFFVLVM